jgi:hypothetical protein
MATVSELPARSDQVARLIQAEFDEMPGMRLTFAQVRRLWNLSECDCRDALAQLCEVGQLTRDRTGRYLRGRFDH